METLCYLLFGIFIIFLILALQKITKMLVNLFLDDKVTTFVYKLKEEGEPVIMNTNRIWAVVNLDTNDCLYSSFDYNRSKRAYDELVKPIVDDKGEYFPNTGDLWHIAFFRYDLNSAYRDQPGRISPFQKSLNEDFRAFIDMCLLKRGHSKNNKENSNNTNN